MATARRDPLVPQIDIADQTAEELRLAYQRIEELMKENLDLRAEVVERRRSEAWLRQLSTPVLTVRGRMLIVPLVGPVDGERARQFTNQLLSGVRAQRARVAVVDLTGVALIDSAVASILVHTVSAARLLGARVILTGISRQTAETLVSLGVTPATVVAVGDLQSGMEEAEELMGLQVVEIQKLKDLEAQAQRAAELERELKAREEAASESAPTA